jgi:hypothetical protein
MKKAIKLLLAFGLIVLVAGFLYQVAYVNIPPQDAPPDIQKAWENKNVFSNRIMNAGEVLILAGIALLLYRAVKYFMERQKNKNN